VLKKTISAIILATITSHSYAVELDAELSLGYDDNPFKLAEHFNPNGGWFVDSELKAKQQFGDFRLRGAVANRSYEDTLDDADFTKVRLDGKYKKRYTISGKKAYSHLIVKYANKNKTYVQRSTGEVATFSGQNNENRYDYDSWGAEAKTAIYLSKQLKTGLEINVLSKDYNNSNIVGLSNLDYDQIELSNDWNYKYNDQGKIELVLSIARRDFDDKRTKSLVGSDISGTDLEYDLYSASIAHKYKFSPQLSSELKASYKERKDNGTGYYDTEDFKVSAEVDYLMKKGFKVVANISYQDLNYQNSVVSDEDDDVHPSKDGYTIKLHLEKDLNAVKNLPMAFSTGLRYDDYDSEDINYEFDRVQVFAGLELSFDS